MADRTEAPAVTLYLVRHARAEERGPHYPDDGVRPLLPKGVQQARRLAAAMERQRVGLDRIFSSPYRRALQTAEPLTARMPPGGAVELLDALATDDYERLLGDLAEALGARTATVACIGHEPYLGELASLLLTGKAQLLTTRFRKGAVMVLAGPLQAGAMTLLELLTARTLKALLT